jgi:hypothetical protein
VVGAGGDPGSAPSRGSGGAGGGVGGSGSFADMMAAAAAQASGGAGGRGGTERDRDREAPGSGRPPLSGSKWGIGPGGRADSSRVAAGAGAPGWGVGLGASGSTLSSIHVPAPGPVPGPAPGQDTGQGLGSGPGAGQGGPRRKSMWDEGPGGASSGGVAPLLPLPLSAGRKRGWDDRGDGDIGSGSGGEHFALDGGPGGGRSSNSARHPGDTQPISGVGGGVRQGAPPLPLTMHTSYGDVKRSRVGVEGDLAGAGGGGGGGSVGGWGGLVKREGDAGDLSLDTGRHLSAAQPIIGGVGGAVSNCGAGAVAWARAGATGAGGGYMGVYMGGHTGAGRYITPRPVEMGAAGTLVRYPAPPPGMGAVYSAMPGAGAPGGGQAPPGMGVALASAPPPPPIAAAPPPPPPPLPQAPFPTSGEDSLPTAPPTGADRWETPVTEEFGEDVRALVGWAMVRARGSRLRTQGSKPRTRGSRSRA